jgi:hypothetical protein
LGRASSGPAQMDELDPAQPSFLKKIQKISKIIFLKKYDFLKYFSSKFA